MVKRVCSTIVQRWIWNRRRRCKTIALVRFGLISGRLSFLLKSRDFFMFPCAAGDDEGAIEMDSEGSDDGDGDGDDGEQPSGGSTVEDKVYVPGQPLEEGEELVHDSSTYRMYHVVRPYPLSVCSLWLDFHPQILKKAWHTLAWQCSPQYTLSV